MSMWGREGAICCCSSVSRRVPRAAARVRQDQASAGQRAPGRTVAVGLSFHALRLVAAGTCPWGLRPTAAWPGPMAGELG